VRPEGDKALAAQRLPLVEDRIRDWLGRLSARLGDADWLDGTFSAGDLIMVSVLLRIKSSGLDEYPNLAAYVARGEARARLQMCLRRAMAFNTGNPPTDSAGRANRLKDRQVSDCRTVLERLDRSSI
jgi:glutathione S-transferase